ncbi:hypothetical protein LBMAG18_03040 [Alphaproteobacteria bacterium]|nr:hypothetical protein LBMAG18_03040 [Alphaproteobacteria bacterium]
MFREITNNLSPKINNLLKSTIYCVLLLVTIYSQSYASEAKYEGIGRVRLCSKNSSGKIEVEQLEGMNLTNPKDIEFSLGNEVCKGLITLFYLDVKFSIAAMNSACNGSPNFRIIPSPILDAMDIAKSSTKVSIPACSAALANAMRSYTTAIVSFAVINSIAKGKFSSAKLCGSGWLTSNDNEYLINSPDEEYTTKKSVMEKIDSGSTLDMNVLEYRQFVYGGKEYQDQTDQGEKCVDATQERDSSGNYPPQKYYLRGSLPGNYNCQKYLISSGQDKDGNRLQTDRIKDIRKSYECCIKRSKEYVCIEESGVVKFCRAGDKCSINNIVYETWYENNERLICVKSYSLCPYNFYLEGGSSYCDKFCDGVYENSKCNLPKHSSGTRYLNSQEWNKLIQDGTCGKSGSTFSSSGTPISEIRDSNCSLNMKAGKCRNYCQYMRHCTVAVDSTLKPPSSITSPFFSQACIDFVGDSKNTLTYDSSIAGSMTNFSAPIAQCFKETMENLFFNRVGHTRCSNSSELPTADGQCINSGLSDSSYLSGKGFIYKKGTYVGPLSIFGNIQLKMRWIVIFALVLSMTLFGVNVLMQKINLGDKKTIMIYFLKFALICFFSLGEAWQGFFFKSVYDIPADLGMMVFNIKTPFGSKSLDKMDGCQFGVVTSQSGEIIDNTNIDGVNRKLYPDGKKYLSIFDTLDCKIAKYLGIGVNGSAANIAIIILASIFTGPVGIFFCLSVLIFGLMLLAMTIHALYIFVTSSISIIIFVFISPLIFPMLLFEKTKTIFDSWLKELMSFCIQPMFLFAYIGIVISVIDMTLVGSASYSGSSPKTLNCESYCVKFNGNIEKNIKDCTDARDIIVSPLDDSVLCLINIDNKSFSSYPGLEVIGVSAIALKNLFEDPTKTPTRILTILKAVLVVFLLYKFLDEIPAIAEQITGGTQMQVSKVDAFKMFNAINSAVQGFVKRARGGSIKFANKTKEKLSERYDQIKKLNKDE